MSVPIGRKTDIEVYKIFADEWTGKVVLPVTFKHLSTTPSRFGDGKTHLLVIDLLKQT
jgi:hypothetical protein